MPAMFYGRSARSETKESGNKEREEHNKPQQRMDELPRRVSATGTLRLQRRGRRASCFHCTCTSDQECRIPARRAAGDCERVFFEWRLAARKMDGNGSSCLAFCARARVGQRNVTEMRWRSCH